MISAQIVVVGLALFTPLLSAASSISGSSVAPTSTDKSSTSTTAPTPLCSPEFEGIVQPTPGSTITQTNDGNYGPTYFEVIYCSGQYFETHSIDGSVLLTGTDSLTSGELLIKDQKPDNLDADAGFYSYRFNASISPEDGDYITGDKTLSVYETTSGYYNPLNFQITSVNVTFAVVKS